MPGTFFAPLFKDHDRAIRQFQIVQTDRGAITLKVVKGVCAESRTSRAFRHPTLLIHLDLLPGYPCGALRRRDVNRADISTSSPRQDLRVLCHAGERL